MTTMFANYLPNPLTTALDGARRAFLAEGYADGSENCETCWTPGTPAGASVASHVLAGAKQCRLCAVSALEHGRLHGLDEPLDASPWGRDDGADLERALDLLLRAICVIAESDSADEHADLVAELAGLGRWLEANR